MMKNYDIIDVLTATQNELLNDIVNLPYTSAIKGGLLFSQNSNENLPLLCVHLDTINTHNANNNNNNIDVTHINYDCNTNVYSLSTLGKKEISCLGGDDRAGLWIALKLIEWMQDNNDYKYRVAFFIDEEIGCVGSGEFTTTHTFYELRKVTTAFIGLDRRSLKGRNEIALYDYDNSYLIHLFSKQGYEVCLGSITDCAILSEASDIACVNLSVGYDNEHTTDEVIYLDAMYYTLDILKRLPKIKSTYDYIKEYNDIDEAFEDYEYKLEEEQYYIKDLEYRIEIYEEALLNLGYKPDDILVQGGYYD